MLTPPEPARIEQGVAQYSQQKFLPTIQKPKYVSRDNGNSIAASGFDEEHNLRVVHKTENRDIIIITFYIYRKGRYGEY